MTNGLRKNSVENNIYNSHKKSNNLEFPNQACERFVGPQFQYVEERYERRYKMMERSLVLMDQ